MNENNLRLTDVQQKAIRALAKADARPVNQMLSMILKEGFYWIFCEHGENIQPYRGWPKGWDEIQKELENEYKKVMDIKEEDDHFDYIGEEY